MSDGNASDRARAKSLWRRLTIGFVLLVIAALAFWALPLLRWLEFGSVWIGDHPVSGRALFVLLFIASTVFMVPGSLLTMLGGYFFGFAGGVPIVYVSVGFAAATAAVASRFLAREWLARRFRGDPRFVAIDNAIADKALTIVVLCRLSLLIPFNVLNLIYGVTRIPVTTVMLGTWLGMLPAVALYVYLGSAAKNVGQLVAGDLDTGGAGQALFVVGLLSVVAVTYIIHRKASSALEYELGENREHDHGG